MLRRLKRKFILTTTAIILVLLTVILVMVCGFVGYKQSVDNGNTLQRITRSAMQPGNVRDLPRDVELPYFVVYISGNGEYLVGGYTGQDLSDEAYLTAIVNAVKAEGDAEGFLPKYQLMYAVRKGPGMQTMAFLDVSSQQSAFRLLVTACLMIGLFSMAVFAGFSVLLAHWMVRPVETAWDQQRQFVSDASHELKTPLTVIMSNAELLQSPEYDEASKEKFSENVLTMSRQMRGLVESLLELARTDNGQVKKSFTKLDLSQTVFDATLPFEPIFFERQLTLHTNIQPDIRLRGSEHHLRQVVEILLDNAQKYSAPGIVNVHLVRQGRKVILSVSNPGEPIPQQELTRIFRRFYRADQARSRTGSFGLGLSIAQGIIQEHGGRIWAVSNATGNCFCVELPCE